MKIYLFIILVSFSLNSIFAQSKWKRSEEIVEAPFTIFKSPQTLNLHTAEVLPRGDLFYGISHRFNGPVSDGYSTFFGLDNGAAMRTELAYGINDKMMITLARANREANHDLQFKYKFYQTKSLGLPLMFAVNLGAAYISNPQIERSDKSEQFQYFGTVIINAMLFDKLAIGVTPTFLHNTIAFADCKTYSLNIGSYIQYYLGDDMTSFILEGANTVSGWRGNGTTPFYDTYSFGVEFETGGHFFKLLLSNSNFLNQSQILGGSPNVFKLDNLVFGFQITRNFGL